MGFFLQKMTDDEVGCQTILPTVSKYSTEDLFQNILKPLCM